jgi:hypothetical protein
MPMAIVQQPTFTVSSSASTTVTATLPSTPANGNTVVLAVCNCTAAGVAHASVSAVSGLGATWTKANSFFVDGSIAARGHDAEIWVGRNVQNPPSNVVTLTMSATGLIISMGFLELTDVRIESNVTDQAPTGAGDASAAGSSTQTTGVATTNAGVGEISVGCISTQATVAPTLTGASYTAFYSLQPGSTGTPFQVAAYKLFDLSTTADPGVGYTTTLATNWAGARASIFLGHGPPPTVKQQSRCRAAVM